MVYRQMTRRRHVVTRALLHDSCIAGLVLLLAGIIFLAPYQASEARPMLQETFTIGQSVQGLPIQGIRMGNGPRSIVLVGAIHGNEGNSHVLVNSLIAYFSGNMHRIPPDVSVYFIPVLNPDGLQRNSRYNARGVDLNRNWATADWRPDTQDASGRVAGGGGSAPFSEPETSAMAGWLTYLRDTSSSVTTVFYHSAYPPSGLVLSGSVGRPTTPAYASIVRYEILSGSGSGWSAYSVTGMAPLWCGDNQIGCFEIELPSRANLSRAQTERHITAVLSVLLWQQTEPGQRCFTETGFCIAGRIREFWERHGGVSVFGLPITPLRWEEVGGVGKQVQWFERNRLELHPEQAPPYDVLLGRIGVERLEQQGRNWWLFDRASAPDQTACRYFAETGHAVCGDMLAAWRASGLELDGRRGTSEAESLALFGMPLSEARTETLADGQTYTVQWFERARFEVHPQLPAPFTVQLGLLGHEMQQSQ